MKTKWLIAALLCFAISSFGQTINELTDYWVDLEFKNENGADVLPATLGAVVYDRKSQLVLSPWRDVTPIASCPNGKPNCVTINIPANENLYVGRCKTKKPCLVDSDCPDGVCRAKLEEEQEHTVAIAWTWAGGGAAKDRFHVDIRNMEFFPTFTSTPTNTPTATPTATPTS